jgi:NitT/TauT family transport system ATP-binding protein
MLKLENVCKVYLDRLAGKGVVALHDVSFEVRRNEFVCIVGPSGCGKSSIIHLAAGFIKPTGGRVMLGGAPVEGPSPDRGVVFQEFSLLPWKSALENVMWGLDIKGMARREQLRVAKEYLDLVGLKGFDHARPHELSGGMKQKVAIARTLALDPEVLLMDEPFSNLDEQTRNRLDFELLDLWERDRKTVVFVTHCIEEAITLADRIILLTARPGQIQREFRIDIPRPRNIFSDAVVRLHKDVLKGFMLCCAPQPEPSGGSIP